MHEGERLRRFFESGFTAADIAEPLVSFDEDAPARLVCGTLERRQAEVAGVRREGMVVGYAAREQLGDGRLGDQLTPFADGDLVPHDLPLTALVRRLDERPLCFVAVFGVADALVRRDDFNKPPARMWLFGMITILESLITRRIEERFPDGSWRALVSAARLAKAESLVAERQRRKLAATLLGCLQLSDKGQILMKDPLLRSETVYTSKESGERDVRRLEALRNDLAHAQDVVPDHWSAIVGLASRLERFLGRLSG